MKIHLDGNIGNDILSRLDVLFAYPENAIYYKKTNKLMNHLILLLSILFY
jgi:hypothetical protein